MSQHRSLSEIAAHLREAILSLDLSGPTPIAEDDGFSALSLELFAAQYEANPVYRRLCAARGATPEYVNHWSGIPAVPTAGFKEFELTCLPASERVAEFHSSGTTGQTRSRHFHSRQSLDLYETSLWAWFRKNLLPARTLPATPRVTALTPPPEQAPNSSLVHMFEAIRQQLGAPASVFLGSTSDNGWTLDCARVVEQLTSASPDSQGPVLLLGTAVSFLELVEFMAARKQSLRLPPASRIMETGGYKGRSRAVSSTQLHNLISRTFGVPASFVISEYGMAELGSQAYAVSSGPVRVGATPGASVPPEQPEKATVLQQPAAARPTRRVFRFPPWARARVVSPETGNEVAEGETGLIQVFDLANVFSVLSIQTEDLGVKRRTGFEFLGRPADAEARGCSLNVISAPQAGGLSR